jgi:hypothetical protein
MTVQQQRSRMTLTTMTLKTRSFPAVMLAVALITLAFLLPAKTSNDLVALVIGNAAYLPVTHFLKGDFEKSIADYRKMLTLAPFGDRAGEAGLAEAEAALAAASRPNTPVATTSAVRRVALVIGNSDYLHTTRLKNAVNDAQDVARALVGLGYEVMGGANTNSALDPFEDLIDAFMAQASDADVALVFYAGHGQEIVGASSIAENWLIPVDARLELRRDVARQAVPLRRLLTAVMRARGPSHRHYRRVSQ